MKLHVKKGVVNKFHNFFFKVLLNFNKEKEKTLTSVTLYFIINKIMNLTNRRFGAEFASTNYN